MILNASKSFKVFYNVKKINFKQTFFSSLFALQKYILHYGVRFLRIKFHEEIEQPQRAIERLPSGTKGIQSLRNIDILIHFRILYIQLFY